MVETDTVFDLFITFQSGELSLEDLKVWDLFLAPLIHQVVISK